MVLPPNVAAARDLLSQRAMSADDLSAALRENGIVAAARRLESLPERFPDVFTRTEDGRLGLHSLRLDPAAAEPASGVAHDLLSLVDATAPPIGLDDVAVLEVTGATDDSAPVVYVLRLRDGRTMRCTADDATELKSFLDRTSAVVGFGVDGGLPDTIVAAVPVAMIDLRHLALLDDPTRPRATLDELCRDLDVTLAPDATGRVRAIVQCLRALLTRVDPADESWRLARACLSAAGNPLARLLPMVSFPQTATSGLRCAEDPLVTPQPPPDAGSGGARDNVRRVFSHLSALGYRNRPQQQEVARAIADVLDNGGLLAVEAPTGTGKSLAYLAPAAGRAERARQAVVVATATKVLQQQIRRDVAHLQRNGMFPVPFRQLFGVSNYICTREVAGHLESADAEARPGHWLAVAVAIRALARSETGVWDDVTDADLRRVVAGYQATRDAMRTDASGCERSACAWAAQCPLLTRTADMAERPGVVSVNHALVAAWVGLARQGLKAPGNVLADGVSDLIFDEAHDLEDTLTAAGTNTMGRDELLGLAARLDGRLGLARILRRLERAGLTVGPAAELRAAAKELRRRSAELADRVLTYLHEYGGEARSAVLREGVVRIRPEFREAAEAARQVQECLRFIAVRLLDLDQSIHDTLDGAGGGNRLLRTAAAKTASTGKAIEQGIETLEHLRHLGDEHLWVYRLSAPVPDQADGTEPTDDPDDAWTFERIPIAVGGLFARGIVPRAHSVTLTSATLTTGGTFDYIGSRLGVRIILGAAEAGVFTGIRVTSPFDHQRQSALVLTNHLPVPVPPQEQEFVDEFARDQVGFLSLTGGRALTLFAARKRMEAVATRVREQEAELAARGVRLLVQGELGAAELAERFRADPGTVAYGVRSYWQGFDAPGETLSYLVIEKPPYPHPDDALVAARSRAIADRGGDPFLDYIVPRTAILLAQGFGRLIRTETDRGAALVADRRMQVPGVANRILLSSLPDPTLYYADGRDDAWSFALRFVTGTDPDLSEALQLAGSDVDATLAELRLRDGEDPEPKLREAARRLFGVELRAEQVDVMLAHLAGQDTIAVLPTGFGKSLCFQLPALLRPEDRATVVVSPLIALIKDQLDDLRGRRRLTAVQAITSSTSSTMRMETLRDLAAGRVRLLYISPERLVHDPVLRRALESQDLAGLVVDEAHCVSDWGHDFRPEFRQVAAAVAHLRRAPRMALTATATPAVVADIAMTLQMRQPAQTQRPADRPNLRFRIVKVGSERERARELLRIVTTMGRAPGIVYASRRATAEEVAALLRHAGFTARHFHAGMVPEQREAVQDDFLAGTTQIMVATKAFGMGVNKPDIGWVVHYDLPDSLDAYVQEAGRAARSPDLTGECVLMYGDNDIARRYRHLDANDVTALLRRAATLIGLLDQQPRRRGDVVFDLEKFAADLGVEPDELNVMLAWLERIGCVVQRPDCSARGTLALGVREPTDTAERERFRRLGALLRLVPQVSRRIDFEELEQAHGIDPDELENDLVGWSLERMVSFSASHRYRRVDLTSKQMDEAALRREVEKWSEWQRRRLGELVGYVRSTTCRRATLVRYFGFRPYTCGADDEPCDACGGTSPWQDLPASAVPDPEHLIDANLIVLQAVAWANTLTDGRRYGESSLRSAVLGEEAANARPLGAGVRRCPQFGALRYLRANRRRWDEAVAHLIGNGLIERQIVHRDDGASYSTLTITGRGRDRLGGSGG